MVGINVGRCHLDRGWKIEDQLVRGCGAKHFHDGFAYLLGVIEFCTSEAFWRILEGDLALASDILGEIADERGAIGGDLGDAGAIQSKNNAALKL